MKDNSLSFLVIFRKLLYQVKGRNKIKNKNNCQTYFFNYFVFTNYFQISFKKLFYKIEKQKQIQTHPYLRKKF